MERPETTARFFIEEHPENLGGEPRHQVLARILNSETCQFLNDRGWGVAIAMIHLDEPTARLIKNINQHFPNLPISAWIVVDDKYGYWTNKFNIPQSRQKVEEVKAWANRFDLNLEALGFDLEPPLQFALTLPRGDLKSLLSWLVKIQKNRLDQKLRGYNPEKDMQDLTNQLKRESIITHSYEMPAPLNKPFMGVLQNRDFNTRVTMVYSTQGLPQFFESQIPTRVLKRHTYPAIGVYSSTGRIPGRNVGANTQPINKDTLVRDVSSLREKAQKNPEILDQLWVFALTDIQIAKWTEEALQKAQA